jgi:pyridoxal phosphate enzyme (YggS family)
MNDKSARSTEIDNIEHAENIAANLANVRQRMSDAALRVGRAPEDVTLVAVSKTKPMWMIEAALTAGQVEFGENRLEEAWNKVEYAEANGLEILRWHFIGTVQSRKSRQAVGPFVLLHSVDRMKLARRLSRDAEAAGYVLSVLLEVNVSGEESKHGFHPDEVRENADELAVLPGIRVEGLMTMAPFVTDETLIRPVFRGLRELRDELAVTTPAINWRHLSMGMTNDFEIAIEEGATIVRVGSAIFGARNRE